MQNVTQPFGNLYIKTKFSLHRLSKSFKYNKHSLQNRSPLEQIHIYVQHLKRHQKLREKKKM